MGEQEVATKNTCEGWFMCNTNVSNIPLPQRGFCHHLLEKGNKEANLRMKTMKKNIN